MNRRTPIRRRTPLRSWSSKRRRQQRQRVTMLRDLIEERGPLCEIGWAGCSHVATDAHEPLTRARGGDVTDPSAVVLTCRLCHAAVHANPAEATRQGWLVPSWEAGGAA